MAQAGHRAQSSPDRFRLRLFINRDALLKEPRDYFADFRGQRRDKCTDHPSESDRSDCTLFPYLSKLTPSEATPVGSRRRRIIADADHLKQQGSRAFKLTLLRIRATAVVKAMRRLPETKVVGMTPRNLPAEAGGQFHKRCCWPSDDPRCGVLMLLWQIVF